MNSTSTSIAARRPISSLQRHHSAPARSSGQPVDELRASLVRQPETLGRQSSPPKTPIKVNTESFVSSAKREFADLFLDPVTLEPMTDPVVCNDGRTYDRTTARRLEKSPYTRQFLHIVAPNISLRSALWDAHPEQRALYTRPPESTYVGATDDDGTPQGTGIMTYSNNIVERGDFEGGVFVQGTRISSSGDRETGTFFEKKLNGEGSRTFAIGHRQGQVHVGTFDRGDLARGKITYRDQSTYEGSLVGKAFHGRGVYQGSDGLTYEGMWVNGVRHGQGRIEQADGTIYEGTFANGLAHGRGRMQRPNEYSVEGTFNNGQAQGTVLLIGKDGVRYTGGISKGHLSGAGAFVDREGNSWSGTFAKSKKQGEGIWMFTDGNTHFGTYDNDLLHGPARLVLPNGRAEVQHFVRGARTNRPGYLLSAFWDQLSDLSKTTKTFFSAVWSRFRGRSEPT